MTDRGPYGNEEDPTEVFPPLRDQSPPPADLPPIGAERDPDPTRVMPPTGPVTPTAGDATTTAMPSTGGPFDPGPPFGGPPGGSGGGDDEPPFDPEPVPWYRQPGPVAALIAGVVLLVVGVIALLVWTGGDDDNITTPSVPTSSSSSTTTTSSVPDTTTSTTTTTAPETTSTSSSTTSSTTTSTTSTTTTTQPPTTTASTTTTVAPTTTGAPTTTIPPGQPLLDAIDDNSDLSTFSDALACTGLDADVRSGQAQTVLAPTNDAFTAADIDEPCDDPNATEPILLLHLVSVDLSAQEVFGADELQTLGGRVAVNRTTQEIGSDQAQITDSEQIGSTWLHTLDGIIQ